VSRYEWKLKLAGGAYDGWVGECRVDPAEILIAWECGPGCGGHATFDPHHEAIVLRTAESYRRVSVDADERLAVYQVGEPDPDREAQSEDRELVGAGAGFYAGYERTWLPTVADMRRNFRGV
jgi:hypothetical protein